jgi:hypothetical protein
MLFVEKKTYKIVSCHENVHKQDHTLAFLSQFIFTQLEIIELNLHSLYHSHFSLIYKEFWFALDMKYKEKCKLSLSINSIHFCIMYTKYVFLNNFKLIETLNCNYKYRI